MMTDGKSESDLTSLAPSSPRTPKPNINNNNSNNAVNVYYVQSPSHDDSNDEGDKSTTSLPVTSSASVPLSPMDSPSHPSYTNSRQSSSSRFSGNYRYAKGRKRNDKAWTQCNVIEEEEDQLYHDGYGKGASRRSRVCVALLGLAFVFSVICVILWGISRPYKPQISVKSLTVHNFYFGQGSDLTGVPTKILTLNCSMKMDIYNPATFFGIHVSALPLNLMYADIPVASGQLEKYYQPKKSHRTMTVNLLGRKVPLYGAGASFAESDYSGGVKVRLVFEIRSQGNIVGKLVKSTHNRRVSCSVAISSKTSNTIKLQEDSCIYEK